MTESFWVIPDFENLRTPHSILMEQANALKDATHGLLLGVVKTDSENDKFYNFLDVVVPALNNYTYRVLVTWHGIELFPCNVLWTARGENFKSNDEAAFVAVVKLILSSDQTKRVVGGLLAQIK